VDSSTEAPGPLRCSLQLELRFQQLTRAGTTWGGGTSRGAAAGVHQRGKALPTGGPRHATADSSCSLAPLIHSPLCIASVGTWMQRPFCQHYQFPRKPCGRNLNGHTLKHGGPITTGAWETKGPSPESSLHRTSLAVLGLDLVSSTHCDHHSCRPIRRVDATKKPPPSATPHHLVLRVSRSASHGHTLVVSRRPAQATCGEAGVTGRTDGRLVARRSSTFNFLSVVYSAPPHLILSRATCNVPSRRRGPATTGQPPSSICSPLIPGCSHLDLAPEPLHPVARSRQCHPSAMVASLSP
jgi:hypothetical protein